MKVLVSKTEAKGDSDRDFHFTDDGEVLTLPSIICEGDVQYAENCGCNRSFSGVSSSKACTTGVVETRGREEVEQDLRESSGFKSWAESMGDDEAFTAFWADIEAIDGMLEESGSQDGEVVRVINTAGGPDEGASFRLTNREVVPEGVTPAPVS